MKPETGDVKSSLLARGKKAFAFLEAKHARVELEDDLERSVLAYVLPRLTIEVEYDWREEAVFVLVCRTIADARPGGYYTLDGQRVRVQLLQALESADLADGPLRARFRGAQPQSGPAAMADQLAVFSASLEEQVNTLEDRFERIFPEADH